jgi:hypothetical protein
MKTLLVILFFLFSLLQGVVHPELLFVEGLTVQPLLEMGSTQTIKFCYKDKIEKPLILSKGDSLTSYCSEQSMIEIVTMNDTIRAFSKIKMSCEIVAFVKFEKPQISQLKKSTVNEIIITNLTTENVMKYPIADIHYFKRALIQ